jgi:DNA-binding beta-propeller fold protein YncE
MRPSLRPLLGLALPLGLASCSSSTPAPAAPAPKAATDVASARPSGPYQVTAIPLPGADPGGIFLDYLGFDPSTGFVWVPAGPTGSVDVVDTATRKLTRVEGFQTKEMERNGKKRVVGPSSITLGDGVNYVGNRGDSTVCAMDPKTPARGACGTLDAMPDGIAYVAATNEVWVTTPRDQSIRILDGKTLQQKARLPFEGEPEGFAVDGARGRFYTNLEDKDVTHAIDLASRATIATWHPACGEDGPHGLRLAEKDGLLFVACSAKAETIDVSTGAIVGSIETGDGVDDLDYAASTRTLYVAAAKAGTLTIAAVDAAGGLTLAETVPTKPGGRNGVVDAHGTVYVADGPTSELLIVSPASTTPAR